MPFGLSNEMLDALPKKVSRPTYDSGELYHGDEVTMVPDTDRLHRFDAQGKAIA